jgi:hypothetical protein
MAGAGDVYPMWKFDPSAIEPPAWVPPLVAAFAAGRPQIDSRLNVGVTSDAALAALRPGLVRLGFEIEKGKKKGSCDVSVGRFGFCSGRGVAPTSVRVSGAGAGCYPEGGPQGRARSA